MGLLAFLAPILYASDHGRAQAVAVGYGLAGLSCSDSLRKRPRSSAGRCRVIADNHFKEFRSANAVELRASLPWFLDSLELVCLSSLEYFRLLMSGETA